MRRFPRAIALFLLAFYFLPFSPPLVAGNDDIDEFYDSPCTNDCDSYMDGYRWAESQGISDPDDCTGNSTSFIDGCIAYTDEQVDNYDAYTDEQVDNGEAYTDEQVDNDDAYTEEQVNNGDAYTEEQVNNDDIRSGPYGHPVPQKGPLKIASIEMDTPKTIGGLIAPNSQNVILQQEGISRPDTPSVDPGTLSFPSGPYGHGGPKPVSIDKESNARLTAEAGVLAEKAIQSKLNNSAAALRAETVKFEPMAFRDIMRTGNYDPFAFTGPDIKKISDEANAAKVAEQAKNDNTILAERAAAGYRLMIAGINNSADGIINGWISPEPGFELDKWIINSNADVQSMKWDNYEKLQLVQSSHEALRVMIRDINERKLQETLARGSKFSTTALTVGASFMNPVVAPLFLLVTLLCYRGWRMRKKQVRKNKRCTSDTFSSAVYGTHAVGLALTLKMKQLFYNLPTHSKTTNTFPTWLPEALQKYAIFNGRAGRKEFWYFKLFYYVVGLTLLFLGGLDGNGYTLLLWLFILTMMVPGLAVTVRRFHDTGHSAWWLLLYVVPVMGLIGEFVFAVSASQPGANRFGPSPNKEGKAVC